MLRTSTRVIAAFLAVLMALVGLSAGPASAHGDVGVIEVDAPDPTGDLSVALRIRLTFENDAEPVAPDEVSEISVEGAGPDGAAIGPDAGFTPTDVPGVYSIDLTFPMAGSWDLTITSVEPDATATTTVEVADVATSTTETGDETADTTDEAPTGDTLTEGTAVIVERGSGDDSQTSLLVTLLLAGVVAAGAIGVVLYWRRRNRVPGSDASGSGEAGGSASS